MSTRLHIVVGFDGKQAKANPTVVYCGRDADAARAAMAPEPAYAVKKWVRNPRGIRKVNDAWAQDDSSVSLEVTAETAGSGGGNPSGEGGAECPQIQQLEEYLAKLTDEQLRESFARVEFAESATREEMVVAIIDYVKRAYDDAKAQLEPLSEEELIAQASEAGIAFKEGATKEEMIAIILDGPSIDQPHPDEGGSTSEGNSEGGDQPDAGAQPDLLSGAGSAPAKPGSLSPKGKGKAK